MKPIDIKGRPIFSRIFTILQKYGEKLLELDWKESINKPNLFYKEFNGIMVFADMRGTEIIPIWDEPYPYVYASGQLEDAWKRRRAINKALEDLNGVNIPHRFSFYDECEPDGLFFGYEKELADGKCKLCGKEFDSDGLFCSEKCEKAHLQLEEMSEKEYASSKTDFPDLPPQKPKQKTNETKSHLDAPNSGKHSPTNVQNTLDTFETPSEMFKKRKASRDRVKHPRY